MGFLDWIYDNIVEPVAGFFHYVGENITNFLEYLRTNFLAFKHEAKKKIAEWLGNDAVFLLALGLLIAAIFLVPVLIDWFKGTPVYKFIASLVKSIKAGVISILDVGKVIDVLAIHKILLIFWDQYRTLWTEFADGVSALASDMGEGTGYIHAYILCARGIVHGTNAVIGGDTLQADVEYYNRIAVFTKGVDDHFKRYAADPGKIATDFIDAVLIPAAEEQRDANQAQLKEIHENRDRLAEIEAGAKEIQASFTDFVALLPNEIEAQFDRRWAPINEWLTNSFEAIDTNLLAKVNAVIEVLDEKARQQEKINAAAAANHRALLGALLAPEALDPDDLGLMRHGIETLAFGSLGETAEIFARYGNDSWGSMTDALVKAIPLIKVSPALGYAQGGKPKIRSDRIVRVLSPFVGDW